jgi:parvulin-like peptidyl-prolyl isomerase
MKRWLREPLLHFLLAGGLLFAAYAWLDPGNDSPPRVVHITAAKVTWLEETWQKQWLRPPSESELRGLVRDYLEEELLAREAKELGLDEDDTIVRRRLAQKMAFLVEDTARLVEPSQDALRQLYDGDPSRYQVPARVSFRQLYFKSEAAAQRALEGLETRDAADLGDASLLERDYSQADEQTVASVLGPELAARILGLAPGRWHGPVASSYGFHLVWVDAQQRAEARPFDQVRAQVLDEWHRLQETKASDRFFAGLLEKYHVVVDESLQARIGPFPGVMP